MNFFCGTQDGILNVSNISLKVNFNSMDKTTDISQKKKKFHRSQSVFWLRISGQQMSFSQEMLLISEGQDG